MQHEWVLDVLTDLAAFARKNELPLLAEQLGDARMVAAIEMQGPSILLPGHGGRAVPGNADGQEALFAPSPVRQADVVAANAHGFRDDC